MTPDESGRYPRHTLRQGEDFPDTVKVSSFRAECHAAASRKGGKADTKIMGNAVLFRFLEAD
jgi:hypothetical protein